MNLNIIPMNMKSYFQLTAMLLTLVVGTALKGNALDIDELAFFSGDNFAKDTVFNFDKQKSGSIPEGWTNVLGNWIVKQVDQGTVVVQTAKNSGMDFNVVVFDGAIMKDFELSVDIRAVSGKEDQGGGLVWRYMDQNNYYVVRYNPLENNFRLYKVLNGKRIQLESASIMIPEGSWFNIRVEMKGSEITCSLNDKKLIRKSDDTFTKAGKTGFWTKADAVSEFDNFKINGPLE
jgi:hypothetical protein